MKKSDVELLSDNGGRRSGVDRRKFMYTDHIPERRLIEDRRSGRDRRSGYDRRDFLSLEVNYEEQRSHIDRRAAWN